MASLYPKTEDEPSMICSFENHPLDDPKLLPCQHSVCTECIKTKVSDTRNYFDCPKCHLSIPLTVKEVDQLPEDILYHIIQENQDKTDCVFCKVENKKTLGTFQCLDCADIFCDQCQKGHTKSSFTILHTVVKIKGIQEGKYESKIQGEKPQFCEEHSKLNTQMPFQYYCDTCKCLACQICILTNHQPKGHTSKSIDEIHNAKVTTVKGHIGKLHDLKQLTTEYAVLLDQEQDRNKRQKERLENEVHDRATQFIDIIEKVKEDILKTIKGHFEKEDTSIQMKLDETKNKITHIDSQINYFETFLKHTGKSQFLQHENEMMKRLKHQNQRMDMALDTNVLEIGDPHYGQFRTFMEKALAKVTFKSKTLGTKPSFVRGTWMNEPQTLFNTDLDFEDAYDVTVTKEDNIVLVNGSKLQVYDSDGKYVTEIACGLQKRNWNVVAKGDRLYVSGYGDVFVIDFKGQMKKIIALPHTAIQYRYKGLAVDNSGGVYISSSNTNSIYKCEPYETDAKIFIQNSTDCPINGLNYLGITPEGNVIVSNPGSIVAFCRQGDFLWQYKGQGQMTLGSPQGICCDQEGMIYIADQKNNNIQLVKDGFFQSSIKIKDIKNPWCVTLDKYKNIVVVHNGGKKVAKIKCWEQ